MHALVCDAHLRTAVAGIRGLGRAGIPVVAVGPTAKAAGLRSRYAGVRETAPDAVADRDGFASALVRLAGRHGPLVLYPCQEASLDVVLEVADQAAEARLPWPGRDPLELLRDKRRLPAPARDAGLSTPAVYYDGPVGALRPGDVPYPSLVKPLLANGALERPQALASAGDVDALQARLPQAEPVLVQERAEGELTAVVLLLDRDGTVVAGLQQRALRTWPPGAGPSALAETVAPDEQLVSAAARLLTNAGYWGMAELQFVDTGAGPALIDVNTRYYGSLPLALRAGVNFPALWHAVASGDHPEPVTGYRTGVSFRWLEADLSEAARGRLGPLLRGGRRPRAGAFWAGDDPRPGFALAAGALRVRAARRTGGPR